MRSPWYPTSRLREFTGFGGETSYRLVIRGTGLYWYREFHHDDVIKWKHFPRNWPFVREIHRSPVNFPHKGQLRGALMFSMIYAWINDWVNNREAGDLRRQHGHYDVIVMITDIRANACYIQQGANIHFLCRFLYIISHKLWILI